MKNVENFPKKNENFHLGTIYRKTSNRAPCKRKNSLKNRV